MKFSLMESLPYSDIKAFIQPIQISCKLLRRNQRPCLYLCHKVLNNGVYPWLNLSQELCQLGLQCLDSSVCLSINICKNSWDTITILEIGKRRGTIYVES